MKRTTPTVRLALALLCASAFCIPFAGQANAQPSSWKDYEALLKGAQLMPEAPPPAPTTAAAPPPPPPEPTKIPPPPWTPNFKLTMASKNFRTGVIKVNIHNIREKDDYYLGIGESSGTNHNLVVESVEFDEDEFATVYISKDGGEPQEFVMEDVLSGPSTAAAPVRPPARPGARPPTRPTARPAPRPNFPTRAPRTNTPTRYEGSEVENHLRQYQMAAIRQGLPPLPVPLQDDQIDTLMKEGHLSPNATDGSAAAKAAPAAPSARPGGGRFGRGGSRFNR